MLTGNGMVPSTEIEAARTRRNLWLAGIGVATAAVLALWASQSHGLAAAIGIGSLIALASGTVGALLGFLFAVPRVLSRDPKDEPPSPNSSADSKRKRVLSSNTNLERVSDWLTTMIVGVGLTQLNQIDPALYRFRIFLRETARVFPDAAGGNAGTLPNVGPMLLIVGLIAGFVSLYLFTRLKLSALFQLVEEDLDRLPSAIAVKEMATQASLSGAAESPFIRAVLESTQPSVDDSLNLMYTLLYRPDGYQKVIDLGGQLSNSVAAKRPDYWFYLAAAFGQKHHALLSVGGTERESAKDNAFDCARRAVALDPTFKSRLWQISDPDGVDNDLADFRDDKTFQAIVGRKDTRS